MKKLLSLFVTVLMAISVFPSVVFASADDDIASAKAMLTADMLTTDNEPEGAVTKSLDLDLSDDVTLPDGVSVSFKSNKEDIIADNGTVTRSASKDEEVTVTATISKDGGTTQTKDFNFTVLAKTKEVVSSDNLYYPGKENSSIISSSYTPVIPKWSLTNLSADLMAKYMDVQFSKDANGCYNITSNRINTENSNPTDSHVAYEDSSVPNIVQSEDDNFATVSINFNPLTWGSSGMQYLYLRVYGQTAAGMNQVTYIQFWGDRTWICDSGGNKLYESYSKINIGQDNHAELKFDYNNNLVYLYLNGKLLNPDGTALAHTGYTKQIQRVTLGYFRTMKDAKLQINDIAIYRETKWQVNSVNDLTAEIVADGQDPDFITENLNLPANSDITWTSNNPEVISNKGIINRPSMDDATVTLTAKSGNIQKDLTVTVKALTISDVGINDSFCAPYYNSALLGDKYPQFIPATDYASVLYQNSGSEYYLDYTAKSATNSENVASLTLPTGSTFPTGNSGKYTIEFDAKYTNNAYALIGISGDGTNGFAFDNASGNLYITNPASSGTEWYGDGTAHGAITKDTWIPVKIIIDTLPATATYELWFNDTNIATGDLPNPTTFNSSIGIYMKARGASSESPVNIKLDNLKIYTESTADSAIQALPNDRKASYFTNLISQSTIGGTKYYDLTENINLNAPFTGYDLADLGVNVSWTSSMPSVISNTGTVTRQESNTYVIMTAAITAGSGDDSVTVTKDIGFTVAAANSSVFQNSASYDFEGDTVGNAPAGWAKAVTAQNPQKGGKVAELSYTNKGGIYTDYGYGGLLNKRYFISADVCFNPDSTSTKMYFALNGAGWIARVGFNFKNGSVIHDFNGNEREFMVPNHVIEKGQWYHIDIDFNAAKKNFIAYIDGIAVTAEPIDIPDAQWISSCPVRGIGIYSLGAGKAYIDNAIVRESNADAPVYDTSSDYTVRSIALTNQDGKTITNVGSATTKVIAKVKMLQNRNASDGTVKIILARYDAENKLAGIVSQEAAMSNKGLITSLEMPVDSNCVNHSFKIFVVNAGKLAPLTDNYASTAPKFDTEKLFNMDTNVEDAHALGYIDEPDVSLDGTNIQAIIYDGDTYYGRKVRHFAYIGLPEGASAENPVPAVVCVHGGGGTAYAEWVKRWNEKGYAAIAMNLNGRIPQNKSVPDGNAQLRHAWPGATQDNYGTVSPDDATWMYSAVTAVIGAHNVLREMPQIDNSKIGITGVSWGSVVTSTTIGVDNRFAFAIPSYGCGYLYGSETYMAYAMTDAKKLWDASNFIGKSDIPILWMNGDRDLAFSLTSTTKSALLAGDNSYVAIINGFNHSHGDTWSRPEPYAFADSIVKNGDEFIRSTNVEQSGQNVTVTTNKNAVSATLYYINSGLVYENTTTSSNPTFNWTQIAAKEANVSTFTFTLPAGAQKYYIAFKDASGNISSTVLYDVK